MFGRLHLSASAIRTRPGWKVGLARVLVSVLLGLVTVPGWEALGSDSSWGSVVV